MKTSTLFKLVTENQEEIENSLNLINSQDLSAEEKHYHQGAVESALAINNKILHLIQKNS